MEGAKMGRNSSAVRAYLFASHVFAFLASSCVSRPTARWPRSTAGYGQARRRDVRTTNHNGPTSGKAGPTRSKNGASNGDAHVGAYDGALATPTQGCARGLWNHAALRLRHGVRPGQDRPYVDRCGRLRPVRRAPQVERRSRRQPAAAARRATTRARGNQGRRSMPPACPVRP